MRIIAGKFRRRLLRVNPGETTRPITDRAKVILFDRLMEVLPEARVLDLFSGTGSMGLEAISRGAASVVCVEADRKAHELLQENVRELDLQDQVVCWRTDALRSTFKPRGVEGFYPYDLIFFDPPYRRLDKLKPKDLLFDTLERLASPELSTPDVLMIIRCNKEAEFSLPDVWDKGEPLVVGGMGIWFTRRRGWVDPTEVPATPESES
ncbi:MAG: 16S rRNA (guanine(966)-N(2))-methyltransferase RsmD [Planctomycetales bacterium]